jgi:ferredoxin
LELESINIIQERDKILIFSSPADAMSLISVNNPYKPKARIARLREEICLGCGLCANACPRKHITLKFRSRRVITPLNFVHLAVVMAIERGKLQNLIFDNQALFSHRAMAAILGVILKLPPLNRRWLTAS